MNGLADRVSAAKAARHDCEAIRDIVCSIWNEKYLAGETPAIARTTLGYPIHTVGGVTLYASPEDLPAATCDLYGQESFRLPETVPGLAYFFVDERWNIVEGFDAPCRPGTCRKASFEDFAREHGSHFQGFEPRRLDLCI